MIRFRNKNLLFKIVHDYIIYIKTTVVDKVNNILFINLLIYYLFNSFS